MITSLVSQQEHVTLYVRSPFIDDSFMENVGKQEQ